MNSFVTTYGLGFRILPSDDLEKFTGYDRQVAYCHIENVGKIIVDADYCLPIDNEYDLAEIYLFVEIYNAVREVVKVDGNNCWLVPEVYVRISKDLKEIRAFGWGELSVAQLNLNRDVEQLYTITDWDEINVIINGTRISE